jgi:hypothetical protein
MRLAGLPQSHAVFDYNDSIFDKAIAGVMFHGGSAEIDEKFVGQSFGHPQSVAISLAV